LANESTSFPPVSLHVGREKSETARNQPDLFFRVFHRAVPPLHFITDDLLTLYRKNADELMTAVR
jgi:hypothetical protein